MMALRAFAHMNVWSSIEKQQRTCVKVVRAWNDNDDDNDELLNITYPSPVLKLPVISRKHWNSVSHIVKGMALGVTPNSIGTRLEYQTISKHWLYESHEYTNFKLYM